MAEKHVVAALRRKYAELSGLLIGANYPEPVAEALHQVGAVLLMFAPGEALEAIKPVRPYKPERGRWARLAVAVLRAEGRPMTGRELARAIAPEADEATLASINCTLYATLEAWGVARVGERPRAWTAPGR